VIKGACRTYDGEIKKLVEILVAEMRQRDHLEDTYIGGSLIKIVFL
jgi:hypothetical protein